MEAMHEKFGHKGERRENQSRRKSEEPYSKIEPGGNTKTVKTLTTKFTATFRITRGGEGTCAFSRESEIMTEH